MTDDNAAAVKAAPDAAVSRGATAPAQASAGGVMRRPGLLRSIVPGAALAALLAAAVSAQQSFVAVSQGSYVAWSIVRSITLFWALAGAAAALLLSVALLPVLLAARGRARAAVLPGAVTAGLFAAAVLSVRDSFADPEVMLSGILLDPVFVAFFAAALGLVAAMVIARDRHARIWTTAVIIAAAVAASGGLAHFLPRAWSAYLIMMGPLAAVAVCAAAVERLPRKAAGAAAAVAGVLLTGALAAAGLVGGQFPLRPLDNGFRPDAGTTAMLAGSPNVILITLDTTRADRMSVCGYEYPTTPNLEKLAADSRLFPNAVSVDSWTLPSHASIFTGQYPRSHGARSDSKGASETMQPYGVTGVPLAPSQLTLATYMSMKGYNTAAFAANYAWLCRQFGLGQGFSYFHDTPRYLLMRPENAPAVKYGVVAVDVAMGLNGKYRQNYWHAAKVTDFAEGWVTRNKSAPFFLFLNYMDAHDTYAPPPPFDRLHGPDVEFNPMVADLRGWRDFYNRYIATGEGLTEELSRQVANQYDGEIAYMDYWVGRLLDSLKAEGVYDDALIIVTSDHGEFFGEHQLLNHGLGLYEGGVRVPIIVKYPKSIHAGQVVDDRVSIIDIFATVLEQARLPMPDVAARPLGPGAREVIAEDYENASNVKKHGERFQRDLTAVYDGDWKLIRSSRGTSELFNLADDPAELVNLAEERVDVAAALGARLDGWLESTPHFDGKSEVAQTISQETLDRLRSLGYIGGP